MATITFIGGGLALESAGLITPAILRVRFTSDPLAINPVGANDALNQANWILTGPGEYLYAGIDTVESDSQAVDLLFVAPLEAGVWTIQATNIQTPTSDPLGVPNQLSFNSAGAHNMEAVSGGAKNDTAEDIIHKHINPALHTRKNLNWSSLIAGLATGDAYNWSTAQSVFDQLFITSASGIYLDRRNADVNIRRPEGIGMPDDIYRELGIKVTAQQITQNALLQILEIYYGPDSVRAYSETAITEPYYLNDGDNLQLLVDEKTLVPITFNQGHFTYIGRAQAIEVAAVITQACRNIRCTAYALAYFDPVASMNRIRIYSGSRGLGSTIRIIGGKAQNSLEFPERLHLYSQPGSLPVWDITHNSEAGTNRFSCSTSNGLDLSGLQVGDYVNIFGPEFLESNRGSFSIINVNVSTLNTNQYFEVKNINGVNQLGLTQASDNDIRYFRPIKETTIKNAVRLLTIYGNNVETRITLPVTTQAVGRGPGTGAYGQVKPSVPITKIERIDGVVTITAPNHGLTDTSIVIVEGVDVSLTPPFKHVGSPGLTDYSYKTIVSSLTSGIKDNIMQSLLVNLGDQVLIGGGYTAGPTYSNTCELFKIISTTDINGQIQYSYTRATTGSLPFATAYSRGCNLGDENALVSGGINTSGFLASGAVFDGATWTGGYDMASARAGHGLGSIDSNTIIATGGAVSNISSLSACEYFDASTKVWSTAPSLNTSRCDHAQVLINQGVMVVGGRTLTGTSTYPYDGANSGNILNSCEILSGGTWIKTGKMVYARFSHVAVVLPDNRVLAVGGYGFNPTQSNIPDVIFDIEIYDPNTGLWSICGKLVDPKPTPIVVLHKASNRVYIVSGPSYPVQYLDLTTMQWDVSQATTDISYSGLGTATDNAILLHGWFEPLRLLIPAAEKTATGKINGYFDVNVVDLNTLTYITDIKDYSVATGNEDDPVGYVLETTALASTIPGPYVYDLNGPAITQIKTTITKDLYKGHQYTIINVEDASDFPNNSGWLCIGFGTTTQLNLPYLGKISNTELLANESFVIPDTVLSGASITLLYQKNNWVPETPETVGSFYLTDSASGKNACINTLEGAIASGENVHVITEYPGDRGLGNEGYPASGNYKISDKVGIWGGSNLDTELQNARNG